jgi:hypothetical protein
MQPQGSIDGVLVERRTLSWGEGLVLPSVAQVVGSATRFLLDGGDEDAANVLLSCRVELNVVSFTDGDCSNFYSVNADIFAPRPAYDILSDQSHEITTKINKALTAVFPPYYEGDDMELRSVNTYAELIDIDDESLAELRDISRGKSVSNQARTGVSKFTWNGLGFRSASELRIAQELDRRGVLFLPNCTARVSAGAVRVNREPDFLVCHKGQWGILEVDGDPFHQPMNAARDHERDRLFKLHGIRIVERYRADECFENAAGVIDGFLALLERLV